MGAFHWLADNQRSTFLNSFSAYFALREVWTRLEGLRQLMLAIGGAMGNGGGQWRGGGQQRVSRGMKMGQQNDACPCVLQPQMQKHITPSHPNSPPTPLPHVHPRPSRCPRSHWRPIPHIRRPPLLLLRTPRISYLQTRQLPRFRNRSSLFQSPPSRRRHAAGSVHDASQLGAPAGLCPPPPPRSLLPVFRFDIQPPRVCPPSPPSLRSAPGWGGRVGGQEWNRVAQLRTIGCENAATDDGGVGPWRWWWWCRRRGEGIEWRES